MHFLFILWALNRVQADAHYFSSVEDVRRAVVTRDVTNVDDVWRRLTPEMHASPVTVYAGESNVPSSPEFPRVLLASDDARFFAAAGTQCLHPSFNQIEFAASDPVTDELSLHLLDFRRSAAIERNPRECLGCHMVNGVVRLRVESYPHWPGWFGTAERGDELGTPHIALAEARAIQKFFGGQNHPRLQHGFRDGFRMQEQSHLFATRFTTLAALAEARAVRRRLRENPDFDRIRPALATRTDPIEFEAALPPDLAAAFRGRRKGLTRELEGDQAALVDRINASFKRVSGGKWHEFSPNVPSAVALEWALRGAGSSLASFSTSSAPGIHDLNGGVDGSTSFFARHLVGDDIIGDFGLDQPTGFELQMFDHVWIPKRVIGLSRSTAIESCAKALNE